MMSKVLLVPEPFVAVLFLAVEGTSVLFHVGAFSLSIHHHE